MDNLINSKNIKYRINAINTKLFDNSILINNANNLIPTTIVIYDGRDNKYFVKETYSNLTSKEIAVNNLDEYLDNVNQMQVKYKLVKPIIIKVLAEQEWCD